jgi:hypothetical protein
MAFSGAESGHVTGDIILEKPLCSRRKLRILSVGAGFADVMLAYHSRNMKLEGFIDLRMYGKNHDVGGTWLEN